MAVIGVPVINAPGIPVDLARALPARDPVLVGVPNNGVRFLADTAFPWCYPGGSPTGRPDADDPADGAVIYDMSGNANGTFVEKAGVITYSGGGFDLTNSQAVSSPNSSRNAGIVMPASVLADLWAAYGGASQRYLFSMWVKLPSLANWNPNAVVLTMAGDRQYVSAPSLFTLHQATGGQLQVRRQTGAGAFDSTNQLTLTPASADYGSVVQISHWRTATQQGLRLRSANGTITRTAGAGAANTEDFSANEFCIGRAGAAFTGSTVTGVNTAFSGVRVYRAMMENLARSGRDPITVLDAAYAAVTARGLFS